MLGKSRNYKETNIHIVTLKWETLPTNYCLVLALIPRLYDTSHLATLVLRVIAANRYKEVDTAHKSLKKYTKWNTNF